MEPTILFENEYLLAVNKPAGLVVHADGKTDEPTLADWIVHERPAIQNVGEPWVSPEGKTIYRPGIVHRLDRDTSGVILIAKNQEAFLFLKEQFQKRLINKTYHTFVYGSVKKDHETIDRPIGRSRSDFRMWSATRGARGEMREAVTEYKTLLRTDQTSFLEVKPKTGRTHQIRVHMKAIQHPVVCDGLYAPKLPCLLGLTRLALHASVIEGKLPRGGILRLKRPYQKT